MRGMVTPMNGMFASSYTSDLACHVTATFHYSSPNFLIFIFIFDRFPSVSATIGDRYPERSIFQLLIALTAGPRFLLILISCFINYPVSNSLSLINCLIGILRTFTCGGWVYITSTDDHDYHDIFMISYIILTLPWTILTTKLTNNSKTKFLRFSVGTTFFGTLIPLVYWFIQHKVHRRAGAYTIYAFFEWSLIILDLAFDSLTFLDFKNLSISIVDVGGITVQPLLTTNVNKNIEDNSNDKKIHTIKQSTYFSFINLTVLIINSYIFWTVYTAIPLLLWYFPLWYMGISGYEIVIILYTSPIILFIKPLRNFLSKFPQILNLLTVGLGIGSYLVKEPSTRLLTVSAGGAFASISLATLFDQSDKIPYLSLFNGCGFTLGLILSSISKFAFYTNNPAWPIMNENNGGLNLIVLIIGIITALLSSNPQTKLQPSTVDQTSKDKNENVKVGGNSLFAAFGFGGLIFGLFSMLTDSSTIITWVWSGYPIKGPLPVPHGIITISSMLFGLYLGIIKKNHVGSFSWYLIGCVGTIILYKFENWFGYIGGLILSIYLTSIIPIILNNSGLYNPAITFGIGSFFSVLLLLGHVWVVAYAFVPGGPLLRERTDIILSITLLCIGIGIYNNNLINKSLINKNDSNNNGYGKLLKSSFGAIRKITQLITYYISIFLIISCSIGFYRFPKNEFKPYHPEEKILTAGIWTIHFGLDNDMWASENRMINLIKDLELDVVGLLESDTQRIIMGNRDLTQSIGEKLGMYVDFGPGPNKHTWGSALLSKFPIVNSTHYLMPSPVGEIAPVIHATLDVYGEMVDIVVFHSGQEEDVEDRRLQSLGVQEIMGSSNRPMILLSYLVTTPLEGNYNTYVSEKSGMNDIDPSDWDRWCEYILFKNIKRYGYARISRSTITDTEVQVGKFMIDPNLNDFNLENSNDRIDESNVKKELRFPDIFYGDGVRGHRFHVFDEPRYFQ